MTTSPPEAAASPRRCPDRDRVRAFPLDGGLLFFHPTTGTHVRVVTAATAGLRRIAPRVAMFGITNACNLDCGFCSRDATRDSRWTVRSAADVLAGLASQGTLEVAFGGGEPFAFPGFAELIAELHETTALALHVTSNGTLLRERSWRAFQGRFGQVRLSIYEDTSWRDAAGLLSGSGQLWGANLLVSEPALDRLPARLAELAALGCHDVSLLSYVGPDPRQHLDATGRARLAAVVAESPLPCRLSVCFGDRVPAPRLFSGMDGGADCGAGYDFVSITPDQRVQSCSFQDAGIPVETAADVLRVWRTRREALRTPSPRRGCARAVATRGRRLPTPTAAAPPITVWRGFSGNNSGECILVGKFETSAAAEDFVARLIPGWTVDAPYSPEWRALFQAEGVATPALALADAESCDRWAPDHLIAIGRSVIGRTVAPHDAFPELRGMAWKLGGYVVPGGVHSHAHPTLLAVIRCRDHEDAQALMAAPRPDDLQPTRHGELLLVVHRMTQPVDLAQAKALLTTCAGQRPLAAEMLTVGLTAESLSEAKKRLGVELPRTPRLRLSFGGPEGPAAAEAFARSLDDGRATAHRGTVLVDGVARRKRVAVLALRHGADVHALEGTAVVVQGRFLLPAPPRTKGRKAPPAPVVALADLERALRTSLGRDVTCEGPERWSRAVTARVVTEQPARALAAMDAYAHEIGCRAGLGVYDVDPLAWTLRRLVSDVRS